MVRGEVLTQRGRGVPIGDAIAAAGAALYVVVMCLWLSDQVAGYVRFLLPVPALLLAAIVLTGRPVRPAQAWALGVTGLAAASTAFAQRADSYAVLAAATPFVLGAALLIARRPVGSMIAVFLLSGTYGTIPAHTGLPNGQFVDLLLLGVWLGAAMGGSVEVVGKPRGSGRCGLHGRVRGTHPRCRCSSPNPHRSDSSPSVRPRGTWPPRCSSPMHRGLPGAADQAPARRPGRCAGHRRLCVRAVGGRAVWRRGGVRQAVLQQLPRRRAPRRGVVPVGEGPRGVDGDGDAVLLRGRAGARWALADGRGRRHGSLHDRHAGTGRPRSSGRRRPRARPASSSCCSRCRPHSGPGAWPSPSPPRCSRPVAR